MKRLSEKPHVPQVAVGAGIQGLELHIDTRTLLRACNGAVGAFTQIEKRQAGVNTCAHSPQDQEKTGIPRNGASSHPAKTPHDKTHALQDAGRVHMRESRSGAGHHHGQNDCDVNQHGLSVCKEALTEHILIGSMVRLTASARIDGVLGRCDCEVDGVVVKGSRGCWRVMRLEDYVTGTGRSWRYSETEIIVGPCIHVCMKCLIQALIIISHA